MADRLQQALVRILRSPELLDPVGAGFLVAGRYVVTCAHVVAEALGIGVTGEAAPTAPVWLDLPLLPGSAPLQTQVIVWHAVRDRVAYGEPEDIAVLELAATAVLPATAAPAPLVTVASLADRRVRSFGFPDCNDDGDYVDGVCMGLNARGQIQLRFDPGRQRVVAPGFSGTAVWDKQEDAVIGMIGNIDSRDDETAAYLIPTETLLKAWD